MPAAACSAPPTTGTPAGTHDLLRSIGELAGNPDWYPPLGRTDVVGHVRVDVVPPTAGLDHLTIADAQRDVLQVRVGLAHIVERHLARGARRLPLLERP